jgi:ABC-2 type transport system permease protein
MSVTYDSTRRPPAAVEEFTELLRYRDLVRQLVRRDVLTRYKRSVIGIAWTMLSPLGMMLVLTVAFSGLFGATRAFAVYLLSGLVAWNFFSQTTTAGMMGLVWGGALLQRIYVPRTVFAVSATGAGLVNLTLALVPLLAVMLATGTPVTSAVAALPPAMLLLAAFALGVGLCLSTVAVYFPDVAEMYQIALLAWMYLTPIIYPEAIVPEAYRRWLFTFNPMYHLVKLFRLPLYDGTWPAPAQWGAAAVAALGALAVGWAVFTRKADEFAYRF